MLQTINLIKMEGRIRYLLLFLVTIFPRIIGKSFPILKNDPPEAHYNAVSPL